MKKYCYICLLAFVGYANATPIGYSVDTISDTLYTIDLGTGATTAVGSPGSLGFGDVEGLSFQPGTGTLFGLDDSSDKLITINLVTGVGSAVGSLGFNFRDAGLSFDSSGNLFASSDGGDNGVYSVNPITGAATFLSNSGPDPFALAFADDTLYGVSEDSGCSGSAACLVSVDRTTGVSTEIGSTGLTNIDEGGLAFDLLGNLWFVERNNSTAYTINTTTGAATPGAT